MANETHNKVPKDSIGVFLQPLLILNFTSKLAHTHIKDMSLYKAPNFIRSPVPIQAIGTIMFMVFECFSIVINSRNTWMDRLTNFVNKLKQIPDQFHT